MKEIGKMVFIMVMEHTHKTSKLNKAHTKVNFSKAKNGAKES